MLYMDKIARIRQLVNFKVEGKYEPMKHQWISGVFMAEHKRCFNLSTMRTGKTGSTLLAYETPADSQTCPQDAGARSALHSAGGVV